MSTASASDHGSSHHGAVPPLATAFRPMAGRRVIATTAWVREVTFNVREYRGNVILDGVTAHSAPGDDLVEAPPAATEGRRFAEAQPSAARVRR